MSFGTKKSYEDPEVLCHSLSDSEDLRKLVFGKMTVAIYIVFALFFQLIAARILTFKLACAVDDVYCILARDVNDKLAKVYKHQFWWEFEFRSKRGGGARAPRC